MHLAIAATLLLALTPTLQAQPQPATPASTSTNAPLKGQWAAFFPFCIDWHDARKRNFVQQSEMLKELGFDGVGHNWLDGLEERLKALDDAGLKLYQVTITLDLKPEQPTYDSRLPKLLPKLKGRSVQLLLIINGYRPADPAGDEKAVAMVREIADLSQTNGVQVLLYPHTASWLESFEHALRLDKQVNRPNVGVMFNLCHWLRVSPDRDYRKLLAEAKGRLLAVSINGADDRDPQPGWGRYIQPLGRGDFDMARFLRDLRASGFRGPIALQCYGIGGDTREHLAESVTAWRKCQAELKP